MIHWGSVRLCLALINQDNNGDISVNPEVCAKIYAQHFSPLDVRFSIHLWEKYNVLAQHQVADPNIQNEGFRNELMAAYIDFKCLRIPPGNRFIFFKQGEYFENLKNYDVTIIFRNDNARIHFMGIGNMNFERYSTVENRWINCNGFSPDQVEYEILYRVKDENKLSYLIFLNSNYNENENLHPFVSRMLRLASSQIKHHLGTHTVEKMAMSMIHANNRDDENTILPYMIENLHNTIFDQNHLTVLRELTLLDFGNGFTQYFDTNIPHGIDFQ
jgi:hypothetical protein